MLEISINIHTVNCFLVRAFYYFYLLFYILLFYYYFIYFLVRALYYDVNETWHGLKFVSLFLSQIW